MTEKQIKLPNKKGKHVKAKKQLAKKVVSSDSEFSDSNEMDTSERDIKKISTDVSQMLAKLKKEHGLEDDDGPQKKKKKPNENQSNAKPEQVKLPKPKPDNKNAAQKNQQQQPQPGNQQQKKKNEPKKQLASNEQKGAVQQKQPAVSKKENQKVTNNAQVKKDKKNKASSAKGEQNGDAQAAGKKDKNKKAKQPQNSENKLVKEEPNTDAENKKGKKNKVTPIKAEQNANFEAKKGKKNKGTPANEVQNGDAQTAGKKNKKKKAKNLQNPENSPSEDVAVEKDTPIKDLAKQLPKKKKLKKNKESKQQSDILVESSANDESSDKEPVADETNEQKKDYYLKDASPICVTNLPTNIKRKQIVNVFKKFGKMLAIRFRTNTGQSYLSKAQLKGVPFVIAFIYFDTLDAAKASLVMNNETFHDNKISVDLDSRDITNKVKPKSTILVGNLKYAVTQALLHETFSCCGKIEHIRVVQTKQGCKGVAFVRFENPDSVALALELDKTSLLDRPMHVERYKEAKLKSSNKIKLKPVKKLKVKNKFAGTPNKSPTKNNNQLLGKSPIMKQKLLKEGKKKNKEFQGVKSNEAKKAQVTKNKKKKLKMHHDKRMALKIAPKENKQDNAN